jgi:hypothetical protein
MGNAHDDPDLLRLWVEYLENGGPRCA